ncbi:MAG TPA: hypothetical protein VNR38_19150 [Ureibacillus sp.]|nr:hypothetical protein [Ureibacillus sp.]
MIEKHEIDIDTETVVIIEQYKEHSASRRHYSNLRFALFPVYLTVQYGILQFYLSTSSESELAIPGYIIPICGTIISFVFLTIENRINLYYKILESSLDQLEFILGLKQKIKKKSAKNHLLNYTRFSMGLLYTLFLVFWLVMSILHFI